MEQPSQKVKTKLLTLRDALVDYCAAMGRTFQFQQQSYDYCSTMGRKRHGRDIGLSKLLALNPTLKGRGIDPL